MSKDRFVLPSSFRLSHRRGMYGDGANLSSDSRLFGVRSPTVPPSIVGSRYCTAISSISSGRSSPLMIFRLYGGSVNPRLSIYASELSANCRRVYRFRFGRMGRALTLSASTRPETSTLVFSSRRKPGTISPPTSVRLFGCTVMVLVFQSVSVFPLVRDRKIFIQSIQVISLRTARAISISCPCTKDSLQG